MGISLEGATNVGVLSWYLLISVVSEAGILRKCMKALFQLQSLWSGWNFLKHDESRSSLQSVSACSRLRIQCFSVGMLHYKIYNLVGDDSLGRVYYQKHLKRYYNRPQSSLRGESDALKTVPKRASLRHTAQRGTCRCQGHYPKQGGNHCFVQMVILR